MFYNFVLSIITIEYSLDSILKGFCKVRKSQSMNRYVRSKYKKKRKEGLG